MNLLLFPGNSQRSGIWLAQVEQVLTPYFDRTYCHHYSHWDDNTPEIDLSKEIVKISTIQASFAPYMVFAKSAGTMLTLKAMNEGHITPRACVLVGLPLIMAHDHKHPLSDWLCHVKVPITIVQNEHDPSVALKRWPHLSKQPATITSESLS